MPLDRREFLLSGIAAATVTVLSSGCADVEERAGRQPAGGWDDLPSILARIVPPQFAARDFPVTDYGATGDGKTDCFHAFAAAIAACNKAGGGRVVVPAADGPYLSNGPIHLLSNVNFYLEQGAEILFGSDPTDYLPAVLVRYQGIRCYNYSPLIYAYQAVNIAVTGAGKFVGPAGHWASWATLAPHDFALLQDMVANGTPVEKRVFGSGHHLRLTMFEPYDCANILVQGVTFQASPFWTMHPTFCSNVTIQNVTVLPGNTNDDGCDPDSCNDVLIEGCAFTTADDHIALKAGFGADAHGLLPCQNVVIQNCTGISTNWGAFTIGSNTTGNIQNVFIQNCSTQDCSYAYFIKSNPQTGGSVKNVFIRSSSAGRCREFVFLQANYNGSSGDSPPLFDNVNFENMTCERAEGTAFVLIGDIRNPIQYVSLNDIAVSSAAQTQNVSNALFVSSSNVTVDGRAITIEGL